MQKLLTKSYTRKQLLTAGIISSATLAALFLGKKYFNGSTCHITQNLAGKVVIVTGADSGIGKETARELARMNAKVVLACRDAERTLPVVKELQADTNNQNIEFIQLDLGDLRSIKAFASTFKAKYRRLDILINNAEIVVLPDRSTTVDRFETQFGINHLGHFYLTNLLLDILKASAPSRVITLTSKTYQRGKINWDDLMYTKGYSTFISYMQSKLANILFSKELQRRMDLEKVDVKSVAVYPGMVRTGVGRRLEKQILYKFLLRLLKPLTYYFTKDPHQGAQTTLYCALEEYGKLRGGGYYEECREEKVNALVVDNESAAKLWRISENLIKGRI